MKKSISAKEQFDKDRESVGALELSIVNGICYFYKERNEKAYLFSFNSADNIFKKFVFPVFSTMKQTCGMIILHYFASNDLFTKKDIDLLVFSDGECLPNHKNHFDAYLDFLYNHPQYADTEETYQDKHGRSLEYIGATGTDSEVYSSMINHIKESLIDKIEAFLDCGMDSEIEVHHSHNGYIGEFCLEEYDVSLGYQETRAALFFRNEDCCDDPYCVELEDCSVEDLLHIWAEDLNK